MRDDTSANTAPVPLSPDPLAVLARASRALERANTVPAIADVRNRAEALRVYARTARLGLEAQNRCAELRLRAEWKAGRLIPALVRRGGDRRRSRDATLSDLGITKSQSFRWQQLAQLSEAELDEFLNSCILAGREITSGGALSLVRPGGRAARSPEWTDGGAWRTILVDPPWAFDKTATRGAAENHYPVMTVEELAALAVSSLGATSGCHCYLWAVNAHLSDAFELLEAWGFQYRTTITWCKPGLGVGSWYRGSTEHLLFATKGSLPARRADVGTWFEASRTRRHSEKPARAFEIVESMSPGPYLELFARARRAGWDAWGGELDLGERHDA